MIKQLPKLFFKRPLHGVRLLDGSSAKSKLSADAADSYRFSLPVDVVQQTDPSSKPPIWSLIDEGERYKSVVNLFEFDRSEPQESLSCAGGLAVIPPQQLSIDCEGSGAFDYTERGISVSWQEEGTGPEHYFQSLGLGFWLEQRGVPCIHANALAVDDVAIGILAPSQTGKTTLTTALMKAGMAMMSDDMMAVHHINEHYRVYSGWPQFRVWPDTANALFQDLKEPLSTESEQVKQPLLPKVHSRFDKRLVDISEQAGFRFHSNALPLKHLYLLERQEISQGQRNSTVKIEPVKPANAVVHLLQNSMLGGAYKALGLEQQRLTGLAKMLEKIPLKKVIYRSGMEHLPAVAKAILADVNGQAKA